MNKRKYKTKAQAKKGKLLREAAWNKAHSKTFTIRFNIDKDKAVIDWLESQENKTDAIRQLILDVVPFYDDKLNKL